MKDDKWLNPRTYDDPKNMQNQHAVDALLSNATESICMLADIADAMRIRAEKAEALVKPETPKLVPHKHAELIKAWADGATIQVLCDGGVWSDETIPQWFNDCEYRIKPAEAKPEVTDWFPGSQWPWESGYYEWNWSTGPERMWFHKPANTWFYANTDGSLGGQAMQPNCYGRSWRGLKAPLGAPEPAESEPEVTDWFPAGQKPWESGVYERNAASGVVKEYYNKRFDAWFYLFQDTTPAHVVMHQSPWRGLKATAK